MNSKITSKAVVAAAIAALTVGFAGAAMAGAKSIELPPDGVQLKPSALPGYAKAQANCVACHSAEYMQYQPPTAPRPYWDAMVKRMKAVFKAPIDDADMPAIVDYLAKTYGNEQPK
jgi:mono/diheme cytochrome c family protein